MVAPTIPDYDGAGAAVTTALVAPSASTTPGSTGGGAIADQIASALRKLGHTVDVRGGRSDFTIDLAVRSGANDGNKLADSVGDALGEPVDPATVAPPQPPDSSPTRAYWRMRDGRSPECSPRISGSTPKPLSPASTQPCVETDRKEPSG